MLGYVKINEDGGIWANRDRVLEYLAKGYKVYTGADEAVEVTEEELLAASQTVSIGPGEKGKNTAAVRAKG